MAGHAGQYVFLVPGRTAATDHFALRQRSVAAGGQAKYVFAGRAGGGHWSGKFGSGLFIARENRIRTDTGGVAGTGCVFGDTFCAKSFISLGRSFAWVSRNFRGAFCGAGAGDYPTLPQPGTQRQHASGSKSALVCGDFFGRRRLLPAGQRVEVESRRSFPVWGRDDAVCNALHVVGASRIEGALEDLAKAESVALRS